MTLPAYFKSMSPEGGLALVKNSCERKRRFQTQKAAQWMMNDRRNQPGMFTAYRCKFCGGWHIGHEKSRL
jgi:hypothetical protein